MEGAECALRNLGRPKTNLQVCTSNAQVIALSERLGFTVDEVVHLGAGSD
jgi:hypothetical protein